VPSARAQSIVPDLEQEIRLRAAQIENKLIAWRRDIHEHPELGEQETRTSGLKISGPRTTSFDLIFESLAPSLILNYSIS
jgi:hypothetical protein